MNLTKKSKITNTAQFTRMVELLEQNPNLAKGFTTGINKLNAREEWSKIAHQLNVLGPPTRTSEGWIKVWADYKFKIKKKLIYNKSECHATGGGPYKQFILSPTEEAAANLLQLNSIINPPGRSFGIGGIYTEDEHVDLTCSYSKQTTSDLPTIPNNDTPEHSQTLKSIAGATQNEIPNSQKAPTKKTSKNDLLDEQLKVQTSLYTEVSQSLSEMKRYSRKNFQLKEEKLKVYKELLKTKKEKLKLYEEDLKCKKEYRRKLLKLRMEEIEIEKRRIELDELKSGVQRQNN